jgi:[protein-PII] uridylyltransferase
MVAAAEEPGGDGPSVDGPTAESYAAARRVLLARSGSPGPGRRRELAALTDRWLVELFATVAPQSHGVALVAVGGYGRGELSPGSDLDLLLLTEGRRDAAAVASRLWYPVWDSGTRLDHAVRTPDEARRLARTDLAVLIGLLDARLIAGDEAMLAPLRAAVLADWRSSAPTRLAELRASGTERWERAGDVAHALEPDLKEGRGGLRDVVALRAVAASWVADRPHGDLDAACGQLLDVRDALHLATGRSTDRLVLQEQDAVARRLGLADADSVLRTAASAARTVAYAGDVTWRRVDALVRPRGRARSFGRRTRGPQLRPVAPGLCEHEGELVLAPDARPASDPVLALRAAATAAREGLVLADATVARLAAECPPLDEPWPAPAREAFTALLGAGPGSCRCGRRSTRPGSSYGCSRSGPPCAVDRSATPCTSSPSTGTRSRPASAQRR